MSNNPGDYYLLITILTYILLSLASIGLIWGYCLATPKLNGYIVHRFKHGRISKKITYWFMNMLFWLVIPAMAAGFYFFTVWYVMNNEAKKLWAPKSK